MPAQVVIQELLYGHILYFVPIRWRFHALQRNYRGFHIFHYPRNRYCRKVCRRRLVIIRYRVFIYVPRKHNLIAYSLFCSAIRCIGINYNQCARNNIVNIIPNSYTNAPPAIRGASRHIFELPSKCRSARTLARLIIHRYMPIGHIAYAAASDCQ